MTSKSQPRTSPERDRPFPKTLLRQSPQQKKTYFKAKIVAHRAIRLAKEQLFRTLNNPIEGQIIMVIGAPGVGKSTLCQVMVRDLMRECEHDPAFHAGTIPVTGMELEAFQEGTFKWKRTRQELLQVLYEPLIDKKIIYREGIHDHGGQLILDRRVSVDNLGEIVVDVLRQRQPRALWFDEAQHLVKVSGAQRLLDQMDTLKSLANRSRTTLVLFGTYEMNVLIELSPQLGRRTQLIHFPRYRAEIAEDVIEFQTVLYGLQKHAPLPVEPNLVDHWDYFYEGSLGCIGILKDWLLQAVGDAIDAEVDTLTLERCEGWLAPGELLLQRLLAIQSQEQQLQQHRNRIQLRTLMGLPIDQLEPNLQPSQSAIAFTSRHPFERLPVRDKVKNFNDNA